MNQRPLKRSHMPLRTGRLLPAKAKEAVERLKARGKINDPANYKYGPNNPPSSESLGK